jgi:hypothetical protein
MIEKMDGVKILVTIEVDMRQRGKPSDETDAFVFNKAGEIIRTLLPEGECISISQMAGHLLNFFPMNDGKGELTSVIMASFVGVTRDNPKFFRQSSAVAGAE